MASALILKPSQKRHDPQRKPPRITTREEALNFIVTTIRQLEEARLRIDIPIPGVDPDTGVKQQRQYEQFYYMKYGYAVAVIDSSWARGELSDGQYEQFRTKVVRTLQPTTFRLQEMARAASRP